MASDVEIAVIAASPDDLGGGGAPVSAVSWAAILAGAVVAAAVSLILLAIGAALGFASLSPWRRAAASAAGFSMMTAIWLLITQWLASGVGGYLTGRLRTRWRGTHTHEVFFRDTAHGFIAWSTATVLSVLLVGAAASVSALHGQRAGAAASGPTGPLAYDVDTLFRGGTAADPASEPLVRAQAAEILAHGVLANPFPADDRAWLAQQVAARTQLAPADAQARVDGVIAREKLAADSARKAASAFAIFTALAMVVGALIACVAAALGGQQRDEHP